MPRRHQFGNPMQPSPHTLTAAIGLMTPAAVCPRVFDFRASHQEDTNVGPRRKAPGPRPNRIPISHREQLSSWQPVTDQPSDSAPGIPDGSYPTDITEESTTRQTPRSCNRPPTEDTPVRTENTSPTLNLCGTRGTDLQSPRQENHEDYHTPSSPPDSRPISHEQRRNDEPTAGNSVQEGGQGPQHRPLRPPTYEEAALSPGNGRSVTEVPPEQQQQQEEEEESVGNREPPPAYTSELPPPAYERPTTIAMEIRRSQDLIPYNPGGPGWPPVPLSAELMARVNDFYAAHPWHIFRWTRSEGHWVVSLGAR